MRDAFIAALTELALDDPRFVLITGDLGFGVFEDFAERMPGQFINAGVAEQNMTSIACGMALEGYKPYTYSIGNFPTFRCLEQIRNNICYHNADVTIVSIGAGFSYGQLGMSHFATEDMAVLGAIPNMRVVTPADPWESSMLTHRLATLEGPKYLRLDKGKAGLPPVEDAETLDAPRCVRTGGDITLVTTGSITREALAAAETLSKEGVEAQVVVVTHIKPLQPEPIVEAARKTGAVLTLEEHSVVGGLGSRVADALLEANVPARFRKMGLQDCFPTVVGDQDYLRKTYGLTAGDVHAAARRLLDG